MGHFTTDFRRRANRTRQVAAGMRIESPYPITPRPQPKAATRILPRARISVDRKTLVLIAVNAGLVALVVVLIVTMI